MSPIIKKVKKVNLSPSKKMVKVYPKENNKKRLQNNNLHFKQKNLKLIQTKRKIRCKKSQQTTNVGNY